LSWVMSSLLTLLSQYPAGLTDAIIMTELECKWKTEDLVKKKRKRQREKIAPKEWWNPASSSGLTASSPFVEAYVGPPIKCECTTNQCSCDSRSNTRCVLCPARNLPGTCAFLSWKVRTFLSPVCLPLSSSCYCVPMPSTLPPNPTSRWQSLCKTTTPSRLGVEYS
jgi:hypothetical protein